MQFHLFPYFFRQQVEGGNRFVLESGIRILIGHGVYQVTKTFLRSDLHGVLLRAATAGEGHNAAVDEIRGIGIKEMESTGTLPKKGECIVHGILSRLGKVCRE